jgi:M6 family metalloprotease-like protein
MRGANFATNSVDLHDTLYSSNIIYQAWSAKLFNFAGWDSNGDGHVTQNELGIAIISNDVNGGGAERWAGTVRGPGASVDWTGAVALLGHQGDFATLCHELSHTLGTVDLYGVWNQQCLSSQATLMSCTISSLEDPEIFHLDPWHKMQLGWSEPRIMSLPAGGIAALPAAQMVDPSAPVILYDPVRGTGEFFMIEYRTPLSPNGPGYDANVSDTGVALWHIQQNSSHDPLTVHRVGFGPYPAQTLWRFCKKCKGLNYITNDKSPVLGPCPAGQTHDDSISSSYQLDLNIAAAAGQHGWRWCRKCAGLFFGPGQSASRCPAGGTHDGSASGDYALIMNDSSVPGQPDWKWCSKCQGLFYGPNVSSSSCPAGGIHDGSSSGDYTIYLEGGNLTVWNESDQSFTRGTGTFYHSDEYSPYLRWADGTWATAYLHVNPFQPGDGSVRVEWIASGDTWVDFAAFPLFQFGTFTWPYVTLADGVASVPYGGTLHFKTGSSKETAYITKKMEMRAYNGLVTIGR